MINKKKIFWLTGLITLSFATFYLLQQNKPANIEFIYLDMYKTITTVEFKGDTLINKQDVYLMQDYRDNEDVEKQIDSFACKVSTLDKYKYDQLLLTFFKESKITNRKRFEENERNLIRYSVDEDLIYVYYFSKKDGFKRRNKHKGQYEIINKKYDLECQCFE